MNMTPKEIVAYLDRYIIGQQEAKKMIAIALRTRYRRMQLPPQMQEEITPKNILMIGSTGVGKTELSRRLAKMMRVPFVKVEASKYTEVGFVGRDVESMVRDLVATSVALVQEEKEQEHSQKIERYVLDRIVKKLAPPLPKGASKEKIADYERLQERLRERVASGELDEQNIEIEIDPSLQTQSVDTNLPPEVQKAQESLARLFSTLNKEKSKQEVSIKEAKAILRSEATSKLLDTASIHAEAIKRAQEGGIIFLDEIDKIATNQKQSGRNDPSKEGVQRDLLPIVEGSTIHTKYGTIKTDHILFIAAGAFHLSKPSDLIPELQGRFPLRVELDSLTKESLYAILTKTKNSLLRQYEALLKVEDVELVFENEAIEAIAELAHRANEMTEDIGARRLHTVLEKVLEDINFDAESYKGGTYRVDLDLVHRKLDVVVQSDDLSRYIL